MYLKGWGIDRDIKRARELFRAAADKGLPEAARALDSRLGPGKAGVSPLVDPINQPRWIPIKAAARTIMNSGSNNLTLMGPLLSQWFLVSFLGFNFSFTDFFRRFLIRVSIPGKNKTSPLTWPQWSNTLSGNGYRDEPKEPVIDHFIDIPIAK